MAEAKERSTPKSRIETLSDLIFGLALSIGALTLIGQLLSNFTQLVFAVLYYGFSFLILISVWFGYTRIMVNLHSESRSIINLNVFMLFLASIEPFLFNELLYGTINKQYVAIFFAIDLAGLFLIQAILANTVASDKTQTSDMQMHFKIIRNSLLVGTIIFFVSTLPFFWELVIPLGNETYIHVTVLIWLIPLFQHALRDRWEKRVISRTSKLI